MRLKKFFDFSRCDIRRLCTFTTRLVMAWSWIVVKDILPCCYSWAKNRQRGKEIESEHEPRPQFHKMVLLHTFLLHFDSITSWKTSACFGLAPVHLFILCFYWLLSGHSSQTVRCSSQIYDLLEPRRRRRVSRWLSFVWEAENRSCNASAPCGGSHSNLNWRLHMTIHDQLHAKNKNHPPGEIGWV